MENYTCVGVGRRGERGDRQGLAPDRRRRRRRAGKARERQLRRCRAAWGASVAPDCRLVRGTRCLWGRRQAPVGKARSAPHRPCAGKISAAPARRRRRKKKKKKKNSCAPLTPLSLSFLHAQPQRGRLGGRRRRPEAGRPPRGRGGRAGKKRRERKGWRRERERGRLTRHNAPPAPCPSLQPHRPASPPPL